MSGVSPSTKRSSAAIHFDVKDIRSTVHKITRYGGKIKRVPTRYDYRPAELQVASAATFADPDGNVFEVQQVIAEFNK